MAIVTEEVIVSNDTSLMQEIAWDFQPLEWLKAHREHWNEDDVKPRKIGDAIVLGTWVKASQVFPPDGCLRFVQKEGQTASHKRVLDNSGDQVRDGQLAESHASAINDVLGGRTATSADDTTQEEELFGESPTPRPKASSSITPVASSSGSSTFPLASVTPKYSAPTPSLLGSAPTPMGLQSHSQPGTPMAQGSTPPALHELP